MAKTTDSEMYDMVCKDRFDSIEQKLDLLLGKILNDDPSLVVRVDRLEQAKSAASKAFWISITAIITALFVGIKEFFFRKM